jgi:phosphopantetheinyl transferase
MPLVLKKDEKDYSIGIWESTETYNELLAIEPLNSEDLQKWESFQSDKRKREWLTVRVLLKTLFANRSLPNISYNEFGKPFLDNNVAISISHTKEFVAILISSRSNAGIDLEGIREKIIVLSEKFINDEEKRSLPEQHKVEYLHVLWGAKEVMFKLYGRGEMDFRENLHVEPFRYSESGLINAWINKNNIRKKHVISYQLWKDMMLAHCVSD